MSKNEITKETNSANQTPIEIALQIDEDGMTKASKLYKFLELEPKNFSRWCNTNIKNNKFAIEGDDYIVFVIQEENPKGGRPKTDYKLTSDFAKKLSMTGNTERHEQARSYFIACEQGLKIATQKLQLSNFIDFKPLTDTIIILTNSIAQVQHDISELKNFQQTEQNKCIQDKKSPSAYFKRMNPKYKMLTDYYGCSRTKLYSEIYKALEDMYDVDIDQLYEEYCYENRLSKDECYRLDAIEHDKQLKEALTNLIDSALVKYGLQTQAEVKNFRRKTLFDMKPDEIVPHEE